MRPITSAFYRVTRVFGDGVDLLTSAPPFPNDSVGCRSACARGDAAPRAPQHARRRHGTQPRSDPFDDAPVPRFRRLHAPDSLQHVISRIAAREHRLSGDDAREVYLSKLGARVVHTDARAVSYAVMGNHAHLGVHAGEARLTPLLHGVNTAVARYLNRRDDRIGPVFAERPRIRVLPAEACAVLVAYHHNNPVRAGVVRDPLESTWTSHRAIVGVDLAPPWLDAAWIRCACGFASDPAGRWHFHDFVAARARLPRDATLSGPFDEGAAPLRGRVAGPVDVTDVIVATHDQGLRAHREIVACVPGVPVLEVWHGNPQDVIAVVLGLLHVAPLARVVRTRVVVRARRVALLAWIDGLGRPAAEMAAALGIGRGAASRLAALGRCDPELVQTAAETARLARTLRNDA
jgi:hypothetical protein